MVPHQRYRVILLMVVSTLPALAQAPPANTIQCSSGHGLQER